MVEILHAAISPAQHHHRLELFRNDRFARIAPQTRRWLIEQDGHVEFDKAGFDGIAKSNVDDDANTRAGNCRVGLEAQAAVLQFVADPVNSECIGIEDYAVVDWDAANVMKDAKHGVRVWITKPKKINILRRTKRTDEPSRHQHRPFQNEALAMRGRAEAIEKPLKRIAGQQPLEGLIGLMR